MQVGILSLDVPPLAVTTTADATYRYRLLPDDVVLVDKRTADGGWEGTYRYVLGACDCPGYQHRADCKHADIARGLLQWYREHLDPTPTRCMSCSEPTTRQGGLCSNCLAP